MASEKPQKNPWLSTLLSATGLDTIKEIDYESFLFFLEQGIGQAQSIPDYHFHIEISRKNENKKPTTHTNQNPNRVNVKENVHISKHSGGRAAC